LATSIQFAKTLSLNSEGSSKEDLFGKFALSFFALNWYNTQTMAFQCFNCGKSRMMGHRVSHSKRRTNHAFMPNLQNKRIVIHGVKKQVKLCTNCIKLARKNARVEASRGAAAATA